MTVRTWLSGLGYMRTESECCAHNLFPDNLHMLQVMAAVAEGSVVSRKLFETAYAYKKAALCAGDLSGGRFGPFWDRLVFSKVKARLGGTHGIAGG